MNHPYCVVHYRMRCCLDSEQVRSNDSIPLHLLIIFIWININNRGLHIAVIFS